MISWTNVQQSATWESRAVAALAGTDSGELRPVVDLDGYLTMLPPCPVSPLAGRLLLGPHERLSVVEVDGVAHFRGVSEIEMDRS